MTERSNHLEELSHKRYYEVAKGQPDIRHWNIADDAGKKIGVVNDLLFDKEALKVRYIITNLKDGYFEENRQILIPVGRARISRDNERIYLPAVTHKQLDGLPDYRGPGELTRRDEQAIRNAFAGTKQGEKPVETFHRETFYEHPDFNEKRFHNEGSE